MPAIIAVNTASNNIIIGKFAFATLSKLFILPKVPRNVDSNPHAAMTLTKKPSTIALSFFNLSIKLPSDS